MSSTIHSSACLADETGGPAVSPIVSAASDKALPSFHAGPSVQILIGDVRAKLRELPSAYFDTVMTSPPYWGLRDYGIAGQLGLERTLGEHLDAIVDVFREIRRVLKQQGTVFLNYGDCYAAAPNGKSAAAYKADGTDDRTFRDKPFSTVGAIYEPGHSSNRGQRGDDSRSRASDMPGGRIVAPGAAFYDPSGGRSGGGVRGENKGNTGGTNTGRIVAGGAFYDPDYGRARGTFTGTDLNAGGVGSSRIEHGGRIVGVTPPDPGQPFPPHVGRRGGGNAPALGMLKPKDLCMIPNRIAIALQDDGWWVRSEIIWHKPNPMPESVYDRPTSAHEKIWLLTKGGDYYYNHAAIREPVSPNTHARLSQDVANQRGSLRANGGTRSDRPMKPVQGKKVPAGWDVDPGHHGASNRAGRNSRQNIDRIPKSRKTAKAGSGIKNNDSFCDAISDAVLDDRAARNVWTIAPAPFSGEFCLACRSYFEGKAKRKLRIETIVGPDGKKERRLHCHCGEYDRWLSHFATFPSALVERCLKAGAPLTLCHLCGEAKSPAECGGMCHGQERDRGRVLDCFGGAGTVGVVAKRLGLDCTLIELNPDYAAMAECRIAEGESPALAQPSTVLGAG